MYEARLSDCKAGGCAAAASACMEPPQAHGPCGGPATAAITGHTAALGREQPAPADKSGACCVGLRAPSPEWWPAVLAVDHKNYAVELFYSDRTPKEATESSS